MKMRKKACVCFPRMKILSGDDELCASGRGIHVKILLDFLIELLSWMQNTKFNYLVRWFIMEIHVVNNYNFIDILSLIYENCKDCEFHENSTLTNLFILSSSSGSK